VGPFARWPFGGFEVRRQHLIGPFVADFYCHEFRLVIELDGDSHIGRATQDRSRTVFMEAKGLRVLRFENDDVLRNGEVVLTAILLACGLDPDAACSRVKVDGKLQKGHVTESDGRSLR